MTGYDFLAGLRVIEVAQLGPSALGGYLADMGADVIKVEGRQGDPVRDSGTPAVGSPDGPSLLHLRWNRGKRSVGIDLKQPEGADLFRRLVATAEVVIEGMRAGVLDRLGLGFDELRAAHPHLVCCSVSGLGTYGPYHQLGSHGPSFDAFAALSSVNPYGLPPGERAAREFTAIGMHALGLHSALGVLAAVVRARATGWGATIEVAAVDSAAHWRPDGVDTVLNAPQLHERPGFNGPDGRQIGWSRLWCYETADGTGLFFQALSPKFWSWFCDAVGRPDLLEVDDTSANRELVTIVRGRTREQWMAFFAEHDIPGGPANTLDELAVDPHFVARHNTYAVAELEGVHLTSTPVKTDQPFAPALAPTLGQHTVAVLAAELGLPDHDIDRLLAAGVIHQGGPS